MLGDHQPGAASSTSPVRAMGRAAISSRGTWCSLALASAAGAAR
ncbi:hypothetical protein ACFQU2_23805 [Siccirubricoccus deserti]